MDRSKDMGVTRNTRHIISLLSVLLSILLCGLTSSACTATARWPMAIAAVVGGDIGTDVEYYAVGPRIGLQASVGRSMNRAVELGIECGWWEQTDWLGFMYADSGPLDPSEARLGVLVGAGFIRARAHIKRVSPFLVLGAGEYVTLPVLRREYDLEIRDCSWVHSWRRIDGDEW